MSYWEIEKGELTLNLNLEDKVAIVTGGGGGLGASICEVLAEEGVNIVIVDKKPQKELNKLAQRLNKKHDVDSIAAQANITKVGDIQDVFTEIECKYHNFDILVNNAGIWPQSYVKDMKEEEWRKTININLTGAFLFSKRAINSFLKEGKEGEIINITSLAAFHGSASGHTHYAASKGGLETFTISLAREVAQYNINVNAVAPGMMRTPMNKEVRKKRKQEYLDRIPLGRMANPIEVAYSVAFLASSKSNYITGATLDVNGGMLMRI